MEWNDQEVELCTSQNFQNFWMSGRCPNNFWTENVIIGNMHNLGNIARDYGIFLHGRDVSV